MPVILGAKPIQDTNSYADYAIGLALPLQIGNNAFNQTFTTLEQVSVNIQNLLLTTKGERVMQPEFGSNLGEILFEQEVDDIGTAIEEAILTAVSTWLPYVNVQQIDIDTSNQSKDRHTIGVTITFTVANSPDTGTVTFTVQG